MDSKPIDPHKLRSWLEKLNALLTSPNRGEAQAARLRIADLESKYKDLLQEEVYERKYEPKDWPQYVSEQLDFDVDAWASMVINLYFNTGDYYNFQPRLVEKFTNKTRWSGYLASGLSVDGSTWVTRHGAIVFISHMCDRHLKDSLGPLKFALKCIDVSTQAPTLARQIGASFLLEIVNVGIVHSSWPQLRRLTEQKIESITNEIESRRKRYDKLHGKTSDSALSQG